MAVRNRGGCHTLPLRAVRVPFLLFALAWFCLVPSQVWTEDSAPSRVSGGSSQGWVSDGQRSADRGLEPIRAQARELEIRDGDMVLGVPETAAKARVNRQSAASVGDRWIPRRDIAAVSAASELLWPEGIIPFVIEPGFTEGARRDIEEAVRHWNSKTVVQLVPRKAESDFVRFRPEPLKPNHGACVAEVGRKGGAQSIWLVDSEGCGVAPTIHEIGHAIGLGHEHQRPDRDAYVIIPPGDSESGFDIGGGGPYDYASIMHYGGYETIPPGMLVGGRQLSAGDIDGVARMYGKPPTLTTVSTNPAGLEIVVDGQRVATPVHLDWSTGREHVLEAPLIQSAGGTRYLFGRWNDQGARRRQGRGDPDATWLEANYIVQRSVVACADPPDAGTVTIQPESRDGFHTIGTHLRATVQAAADSSHEFMEWSILSGGLVAGSWSSNPIVGAFGPEPGQGPTFRALFSESPVYLIDANVEGAYVRVNGDEWPVPLPWAFSASTFRSLEVDPPSLDSDEFSRRGVRYRFLNWSDGGPRTRVISVPESGGSITLNVAPEYQLRVEGGGAPEAGRVLISPQAEDGFYAEGTQVSVTAVPAPGRHFGGWLGDVSSEDLSVSVVMDGPKFLEATFTLGEPLESGVAQGVALPAAEWPEVHSGEAGFNILVPPDATELSVEFRSSSSAQVDLYASLGYEPTWFATAEGRVPTIQADFESKSPGANETIVIDRQSTPPLTPGIYFIGFGTQPSRQDVRGTLSASIKRVGVSEVTPRAFTFVSATGFDPPPQSVQVVQASSGSSRYRVESDQAWLMATPREWSQTGPGMQQLSITVNNAALPPGTHQGKLKVLSAELGAPPGDTPKGIEVPVTFVNVGQISTFPAASAVEITTEPRAGQTYGAGEKIEVEIQLTRPVEVTGAPQLTLAIGNRTRQANWNAARSVISCGESYTSLVFTYPITASDSDLNGISVPTDALTLGDATIRGLAGTDMHLALGRLAISDAGAHRVNGSQVVRPQVDGLWISSSPQDGDTYGAGELIEVGLSLDVEVVVTGRPQLALLVGNRRVQAALSNSHGNSVWFRYVVQAGDRDLDGISVPADGLSLNGGAIRSLVGTAARLSLGGHEIVDRPGQKADGSRATIPTVRALWLHSQPLQEGRYGVGEVIDIGLEFSLPVEVGGQPQLALSIGNRRAQAALAGSGGNLVSFQYVVQAGDLDSDGIGIPMDGLTLNGGFIRSLAGTPASLDLGNHAVTNANGHMVDGRQ